MKVLINIIQNLVTLDWGRSSDRSEYLSRHEVPGSKPSTENRTSLWVGKTVLQKVLATKHDIPSLIPGTHVGEGENRVR